MHNDLIIQMAADVEYLFELTLNGLKPLLAVYACLQIVGFAALVLGLLFPHWAQFMYDVLSDLFDDDQPVPADDQTPEETPGQLWYANADPYYDRLIGSLAKDDIIEVPCDIVYIPDETTAPQAHTEPDSVWFQVSLVYFDPRLGMYTDFKLAPDRIDEIHSSRRN